jgi:anaerobic selenocysteine-containing dehydrogenase
MYYGGTTYENKHGLGVHLSTALERGEKPALVQPGQGASLRPKENELMAVPVTRLYDRGITVETASLLAQRIGEPTVLLHPDAAKRLGLEAGQTVTLSFDGVSGKALLQTDDTISTGVALVPRSMGLPIREPVPAKVD